MITPEEVLSYWVDDVGPKGWYGGGEELDADVRRRFSAIWQEAREGACGLWLTSPVGTLGYIILTDQLPRNMFRGTGKAFDTDRNARAATKVAMDRGWDTRIAEPVRQFFYLPLVHSENLIDQDRGVRLMASRLTETGADNLRHAKAHREVIRKFGRFPYRNTALARATTQAETAFLEAGAYAEALRWVDEAAAADLTAS